MSTEQQSQFASTSSIHPGTTIGLVTLRVTNLARSRQFYEGILAFQPLELEAARVVLGGQDRTPLLELLEIPGGQGTPQSRRATGLYHVAILFPTRADLGRELLRVAKAGIEIGQGDHLVSEALYISDPDDNGIELYQDRPRSTWRWANGSVHMATDPVDIQGLAEEGMRDAEPWDILPAGTRVGHIHLQVGNIPDAKLFYHDILGFDITAQLPGALFVSAGGYHHHIGLNTWHSLNAGPTPERSAGLQRYEIAIPSVEGLHEVRQRLASHNVAFEEQGNALSIDDPWGNHILLVVRS